MKESDKSRLFQEYLSQQADNVFINDLLDPDNIQVHKRLDQDQGDDLDDLEKFKAIVRHYTKTDNEMKQIKAKVKLLNGELKTRRKIIESITPTIMKFMASNDIDELNSKDGVIKYRTSMVKTPLTQKNIKEKLYSKFEQSNEIKNVLDVIFSERAKIEKQSLSRKSH